MFPTGRITKLVIYSYGPGIASCRMQSCSIIAKANKTIHIQYRRDIIAKKSVGDHADLKYNNIDSEEIEIL